MKRVIVAGIALLAASACSSSKSDGSGGAGGYGTGSTGGSGGGATGGSGGSTTTGGSGGTAPSLTPTCTVPTSASGGTCYPGTPCNPVTNEGCTAAGAACDVGDTGFQCYDPPNDVPTCGACSDTTGFCEAGNVCVDGQCLHYCCTDADCGSGKCYAISLQTVTVSVQVCLDAAPPSN